MSAKTISPPAPPPGLTSVMSSAAMGASSLVTTVPSIFLLVKSAVMVPVSRPVPALMSLSLTSSTPWWPSNRTLPLNAVSEACVAVS